MKLFTGLQYVNVNTGRFEEDEYPHHTVEELYIKAALTTSKVNQDTAVHIFWFNSLVGTLRGQC